MDNAKIKVMDEETGSEIIIDNNVIYTPSIPKQENAYTEQANVVFNGTNKVVSFNYPSTPTEDYQLQMWKTLDKFEEEAWAPANVGIKTGYDCIDNAFEGGLYPGVIMIAGDSNLGKCLSYDSEIVDAFTGEIKTIEEIYKNEDCNILSLQSNFKLNNTKPNHFIDDGVKPVFEVTTSLGRKIKTTLTHPYLTINGWKPLKNISVGEYIATPRVIPVFGKETIPEHECKMIGYFTAEGGLSSNKAAFTNGDDLIIADFKDSILKFNPNSTFREEARKNCTIINVVDKTKYCNSVLDWVRENNMDKKAIEKTLPKKVFTATKESLSTILRAMFDCDGSIYYSTTWCIEYSTSSYKMAKQIQHLLLRFGLCFSLREKHPKFNGKRFTSYSLEIHDSSQVKSFIEQIGFYAKNKKAQLAYSELQSVSKKGANKDIIPGEIWDYVYSVKKNENHLWQEVDPYLNVKIKKPGDIAHNFCKNKRNAQRKTIESFGKGFNNQYLIDIANSDIYWDKITSIQYMGKEQVYDLTIPDTHNFIANDICVHNTALISNLAMNVVKNNNNVYVMDFSLDDSMPDKLARMAACSGKITINAVKTPLKYQNYPLMLIRRRKAITELRNIVDKYRAYDSSFSTFVEDIQQEIIDKLVYFDQNKIDKKLVVFIDNFHDMDIKEQPGLSSKDKFDTLAQWCQDFSTKYNITIICSAELKKLNSTRRPQLDDVRETVKIKYAAKAVLLVYNEVHYKGEAANIYYSVNNNPYKQPIFEVHFAKNKYGGYKGRNFFEFYPDMAYLKESDPQAQKTYTSIVYG